LIANRVCVWEMLRAGLGKRVNQRFHVRLGRVEDGAGAAAAAMHYVQFGVGHMDKLAMKGDAL